MTSAKVEFLSARKQQTKEKGEAVIISFMVGNEIFEAWLFNEESKKKVLAKKKGQECILTWKLKKFKGYINLGELVAVD